MAEKRSSAGVFTVLVAALIVLAALRFFGGGVAPTPGSFTQPTLAAALQEGEATNRPVLALATADWCPPCQSLKRGALTDKRVTSWIDDHVVAVSVDFTSQNDAETQRAQRLLNIASLPTLVLLSDGEEIGRISGDVGADRLLEWLEAGTIGLASADG